MNETTFLTEVKSNILRNHALEVSDDTARQATQATLETLGQQLPEAEADAIAARLPSEFGDKLKQGDTNPSSSLEEFVGEVADRLSVGLVEASYYVRAVLAALTETLAPHHVGRMADGLPDWLKRLFQPKAGDDVEPSLFM